MMLAFIRGKLVSLEVKPHVAVLEVHGIGYETRIHERDAGTLRPFLNQEVQLHVVQLLKQEQWWELYGFLHKQERWVFDQLMDINGVGAKMALAILGFAEVPALVQAVMTQQAAFFRAIPGIGPKVAQRILVELEHKVKKWPVEKTLASATDGGVQGLAVPGQMDELRGVLEGLGYHSSEIEQWIQKALVQTEFLTLSFDEQIRWMLMRLSRAKIGNEHGLS
jgi:Holliday junction DNA helicase RuvA